MDFFFVQFRDMNYFQNLPRIMDYSDHPPPPPTPGRIQLFTVPFVSDPEPK